MRGPEFDSIEEGENVLSDEYGIGREVLAELFDEVDCAAEKLIEEYGFEGEVDLEVVQEYLKIAFAEDIVSMANAGVWDVEEDTQRIIDEMDDYHGANTRMMVGRVASRSRNMMRLSGAIMQDTYSSSE